MPIYRSTQERGLPWSVAASIFIGIGLVATVGALTTPYMAIATVAYMLLVAGLLVRPLSLNLHAKLMGTGISLDLVLVIVLQIQREAVQTAVSNSLSFIQIFHAATSTLATIFYIPTVVLGLILLKNPNLRDRWLRRHRFVALSAFVFRTLGYATMFSMLKYVGA